MRSQYLKDLYYLFFGKISILSFYWHKAFSSSRLQNAYVNIGCGPKYVPGMINVDGNIFCKKDIWLDVGLGLPFSDCSLKGIYASHVIEHFDGKNVKKLFVEFYRVLKFGGVVRLVVPSLEYAVRAYQAGDLDKMPEWPDKYTSIGGRFNNFMLCRNQHFLMFDFSLLEELLKEAGFSKIFRKDPHSSMCFSMDQMKFESDPAIVHNSLYVESIKE